MKPDNEAPEILFTWLGNRNFEDLSASERKTVLSYFTREEYENMHEASLVFRFGQSKARKELVMDAFDQHHPVKVKRLSAIFNWKLAAALMPAGLIALIFFLKQENGALNVATAQVADTVYINREIVGPKEIIHDTVYLVRQAKQQKVKEPNSDKVPERNIQASNVEDLQVFSAAEIQTLIEDNKGSSLEEDTLWRSFEAFSL